MDSYKQVKKKLEAFIRKFYLNKLLKGVILFCATGLIYLLVNLLVEHFLWLNSTWRTFLFWLLVGVGGVLFIFFILIPLAKLFKLTNGITAEEAAKIIGIHFPEVNDSLLNILQLKNDPQQSELLLAGIAQKSAKLKAVPFTAAVTYKTNTKYLKYLLFPVILILGFLITGNITLITSPLDRLAKHDVRFEAPAPFRFLILNDSLSARENTDYKILIASEGTITPERPEIHYNNQRYFLKKIAPGKFEYTFSKLKTDVDFMLIGNGVSSRNYRLNVIKVPKLLNFMMKFNYPKYLGKINDSLSGTGSVRVPEGTKIMWDFNTINTDILNFSTEDSLHKLKVEDKNLQFSKTVYKNIAYRLSTTNKNIKDFEALDYNIRVIKDELPEMEVKQKLDSIDEVTQYFYGKISDDHGLSRLNLVYYPENEIDSVKSERISISKGNFEQFHYTFPGNLELRPGVNYTFYFKVWDNDAVNGVKAVESRSFNFRRKTIEEIEEEKLNQQGESIKDLNKSLENIKASEEELDELNRLQKEQKNLDYNQRKKLNNFIQRQQEQSKMMRNYADKLKRTLEDESENNTKDAAQKEELKNRLERNEERLKENEALLEELKKVADKINREELGNKLEELSKKNQNEERNLEQLLELTKAYYVEEKLQKLARDLKRLSEKQEQVSEEETRNSLENQKKIAEEFKDFQEQMEELGEDNKALKQPKELERDKISEERIEKDLRDAEKDLQNKKPEGAKEKQQNAAQEMKEMSRKMQQKAAQQSTRQLKANIESLRQILDNLVTFSFEQEDLLEDFNEMEVNNALYASKLRRQNILKENFKHVDDSLYSLALSNSMISEEITKKLTDIEFDLEKSLERLAQNKVSRGTSSQQYVVTGANDLAYLLSKILSSMQRQANPQMGKGQGENADFQLQDIIKKQQELNKEFEKNAKDQQNESGRTKGESMTDGEMGELFEIYKQQQELRQKLQELNKNKRDAKGDQLAEEMRRTEEELLDKGFDPKNQERLQKLAHDLMEYDEAQIEQGKNEKRESQTNKRDFKNTTKDQSIKAKEYFNSLEILNRQSLPLREIYKQKVKSYFERKDN
ncbi:hypothetical protein SAMN05444483_102154 [Salegentibacter echinorum]|uniref:Uncharacterized protein n=1 Tax=Salegentibacter echinorum TaxID=1073325 RepID=A0A1M5DYA9_SALEC|nr:hypothetical protein [Salegentibacter echinorum]SHF71792.1 hypothetical protein SAMN05444483_102154 [Salegentibacter echinorum]